MYYRRLPPHDPDTLHDPTARPPRRRPPSEKSPGLPPPPRRTETRPPFQWWGEMVRTVSVVTVVAVRLKETSKFPEKEESKGLS